MHGSRLGLIAEQGRRKVVTGCNKMITIMTVCWLLVTQVFKGITSSRRGERKSTVGNSVCLPSGTNMQDYDSQAFYSFLEYLSVILRSRLMFMIVLIIYGLFEQYKLIQSENKKIRYFNNTLTFRLVAVKLCYVTYCSATFWKPTIRQHYGNVDGRQTFRDLFIPVLGLMCFMP